MYPMRPRTAAGSARMLCPQMDAVPEHPQARGLPGPVRAEERDEFAAAHFQIEIGYGLDPFALDLKVLAQAPGFDDCVCEGRIHAHKLETF
jgi:hypothetical protein